MPNVLVKMAIRCERAARRLRGKPPRHWIRLDYAPSNRLAPRYTSSEPHPGIREILDRGAERYAETLRGFSRHFDDLRRIPVKGSAEGVEPYFDNSYLGDLDFVSPYGFLARLRPKR